MPPLYDAHQHLHFPSLDPHREKVLKGLASINLKFAAVNATNEAEWHQVASLAGEFPEILPSYGIHPWDCGTASADWLPNLRAQLEADPRAGVGEIGLDRWIIDGIRPDDPRIGGLRVATLAEQLDVFSAQLRLAAELGRAASIHCVQAFGAVLDTLQQSPRSPRGFLLHGYGGPAEMVRSFVELGAYFSFNLEWLAPRHAARLANFKLIPLDRLLVETDAPEKAPPPELNRFPLPVDATTRQAVNHPANVVVAYEALAQLREMPVEALAAQVEQNFRRLFL
ncbi:MAG: TatD family hydrolase [Rariglobus sp.]